MKLVISLFLALFIFNAYADNIITDKNRGSVQIKDNAGQIWPASVVYTTDGAGNVSPISGGGGGGGGGTVTQGPKGGTATPWVFDLQYFNGALASATNPIPYRLSDGSTFISPATSALQTSGNATLTSINGKLPSLVAGDLPIALNDGAGNPITSSAAGSQRPLDVQLHNSAGNPFGTAGAPIRVDPTGTTVQPVKIDSTNFIVSAANSTTSQLASNATFTGTIESIFSQQSISVLVVSDKAGTLTLNQYIDAAGTKLISSWSYPLSAGTPFSRAFTGNGNYFNLTYKNTDSSATTALQIDTAYGTLPATTNLGNGNVAINEINGDSISNALPSSSSQAVVTRSAPQKLFRTTFANSVTGGVDSAFWSTPTIGTGMTVNQTASNLVITSGTTANDETIIRSNQTFKGNLELKWSTILSQRIINQTFYVELVDLIGDGLAYTINSATSVTVTIPNNPFTSANVGQSMIMQNITGTAGTIPGRYAIASVAGNNVTFTVAGYPATGTGTMSLVGWNYVRASYSGATATNVVIETQRRGYNTNASFTATINTTASSGHLGVIAVEDSQVALLDSLQAAAATLNLTRRGEIVQSLPEENTAMYMQIHVLNGSTAPASTTTWTLGLSSIATRSVQNVAVNSISSMSQNTQLPVNVVNTPAVSLSSGTVTTVTTLANGHTAHS